MLVVVGGNSRKIGKTSVVAGLIRKFRDRKWTAVKISQHGHGGCEESSPCHCAPEGGTEAAVTEEYQPGGTDSGRFLAAGARRSFWLRAGQMRSAAGPLTKILDRNDNVIVESTSVLEVVKPDLFLFLLDLSSGDIKPSSVRYMDRADALLVVDRGINLALSAGAFPESADGKPRFPVKPPRYLTAAATGFVAGKLADVVSR